ncbi:hypothetical protein GCM10007415_40860 [Parapedobacter pyrenivorans]|uniref:YD repeat-containing protein n=1 Tax=Parapedobacter pyrenivorans TaxID=1305674 RepID=A0A917I123_9SPHI|nr:hypothetical protein [Parapedobacter pyrenivorans]GGH00754.1 hypothetical protein GCM10007415_40860 [Parapedobacter pyrenivorans]
MKNKLLLLLPVFISIYFTPALAQQKIKDHTSRGAVLPTKDALLELESTNKGLLHARVQLIRTDDAAPLSQHRAGMMVYNTATGNDVVPGIYYNNGNRWILVAGGSVTPINYNPDTYELTYIDVKGDTQVINLEEVVQAVETVTVLGYDASGHQLTYQDESGLTHVLDLNVGTLAFDDQTNVLAYTNEDGTTTNIPLNNTSLSYDPSLGILRYVNTLGQLQEFNLSDVVDQLETVTALSYNSDTHVLTYIDENSATHAFNLDVGRLAYDNATNTLNYTDEEGTPSPLPLNNTGLEYDTDNSQLVYTNTLGLEERIDLAAIVAEEETLTVMDYNVTTHLLTYQDEDGGTQSVDLSAYLDDTDDQAISLAGNTLTLEDGGTVDLSPYLDNTDDQQVTDFSITGNTLTLTLEDGGTQSVDLSAYLDDTDDQAISLAGNTLTLEDGGTVDLSPYLDNTDDQQVTDFSITGNTLTLTLEDGGTQSVDLSAYLTEASNGLHIETVNPATEGHVKLGGTLTEPTAIQTDFTNTLAITGLEYSRASDDKIVVADATTGELKALKATMPKFFYMPSIIIPTAPDQLENPATFGTIDLYEQYQGQFGTPRVSNPGATIPLPVLPRVELDYHVTWFDENVFENVNVSDLGILTYAVKTNADVTIGSFMNIVFAVKP